MSSPDYEAALRELYAVQSKLAEAETRIKTLEHLVSDDAAAEEWLSQRAKKAEARLSRVVEIVDRNRAGAGDAWSIMVAILAAAKGER
jgi:hypothetical protein